SRGRASWRWSLPASSAAPSAPIGVADGEAQLPAARLPDAVEADGGPSRGLAELEEGGRRLSAGLGLRPARQRGAARRARPGAVADRRERRHLPPAAAGPPAGGGGGEAGAALRRPDREALRGDRRELRGQLRQGDRVRELP